LKERNNYFNESAGIIQLGFLKIPVVYFNQDLRETEIRAKRQQMMDRDISINIPMSRRF
jgi:hypothetical protein